MTDSRQADSLSLQYCRLNPLALELHSAAIFRNTSVTVVRTSGLAVLKYSVSLSMSILAAAKAASAREWQSANAFTSVATWASVQSFWISAGGMSFSRVSVAAWASM